MCVFSFYLLLSCGIVIHAAEDIAIDSLCCGVSDELFTPYLAKTPLYVRILPA